MRLRATQSPMITRLGLPGIKAAFLICSVILSISIRTLNTPQLEQKYLLGIDSYRFLRQADIITSRGSLPPVDAMRWQPIGRDLSTHLNLFSYALAYGYRLLRLIHPRLTLYQVALYSPVVCYTLGLLLLYLIWKRIFDASTALLAVNLSAVFPFLNLHRSAAGFADRDAFCLLLWLVMIFLYLKAVDQRRFRRMGYALGSGIAMGMFALSWEGCGLASACIAVWAGLRILRNRFDRRDVLVYSLWYFCFALISLTLTRAYQNWLSAYVFFALGLPTVVWFCTLILLSLREDTRWKAWLTLHGHISKGAVSCVLGGFAGGILLLFLAFLQSTHLGEAFQIILDNFMSPLGKSRLMHTVMELKDLSGVAWIERYSVVILAAIGASVILAYRFFSSERVNFYLALTGFELILCGTLLSLFVSEQKVAEAIYGTAILSGCLAILISYLLRREPKETAVSDSEKTLFVLIWLLITLFSTRGAERYNFFLDPLIALLCSFLVLQSFRRFTKGKANRTTEFCAIGMLIASEVYAGFQSSLWQRLPSWSIICPLLLGVFLSGLLMKTLARQGIFLLRQVGYLAIALILVILMSSDAFHTGFLRSSTEVVSRLFPILPQQQKALAEIADQTSEESVIAAWWDYGSRINWFAGRKTVIDEDHYIPYWIHLMGRHVFAAQSPQEALTFLYTHQATHLMITTADILRLKAITYTGGDDTLDRLTSIYALMPISGQHVAPSIDRTHFIFHRNFFTTDFLELDGKRYPPGHWHIHGVSITWGKTKDTWRAVLHGEAGGARFSKPPNRFQIGETQTSDPDGIPGSIVVFPDRSGNILQGFYVPETAQHLLAVQLYLFMEDISEFSLVYDTNEVARCDRDGFRLWKINYPEGMQPKEKYLARDFPPTEKRLKASWQRGDFMGLQRF